MLKSILKLHKKFQRKESKVEFLNFEAFHKPIRDEMVQAFAEVYDSNWFILGQNVKQFEQQYARFNNTRHALGVSNGLDALFLALKSVGVGPGDQVIVPSNTFIATALAVSYTGATPVFAEPNIRTYNMDPLDMESAITEQTKAVIPVHLYGQACQMDRIKEIANHYGLFVIEDNAQAQGATFKGRVTGSWGIANATSFYPGKNIGALGDAGAVTTNDSRLAEKIDVLRNYGSTEKYVHDVVGYNKRMDEMQAAFLNVKLPHLPSWIDQRRQIAGWYDKHLAEVGDLILPAVHPDATHVYHLYVVRSRNRDQLQTYLKRKGIETLIHYPVPPHLQLAYQDLNIKRGQLPVAEQLAEEVLSLPIWPGMTQKMVKRVAKEIKNYFKNEYRKNKSFSRAS